MIDRNELAQALFEEIGDAAFVVESVTERLVEANPMAQRLTGLSRQGLLGRSLGDLLRADSESELADLRRLLQSSHTFHSREKFLLYRALEPWTLVSLTVTRLPTAHQPLVLILARDISEHKRAQATLLESEKRWRDLVELSPDGIGILDEGRFAYVNQSGAKLIGLTPADLLGRPLADWLHPADAAAGSERQTVVGHEGRQVPLREFRLRHADGGWRVLESCAGPCLFNGRPAVQFVAQDITERKRAEEAIRTTSAFRETIIRTAAEGICVCFPIPDYPHVGFSVWNDRMTEITGYTMAEINRLGWYQTVYPDPEVRERAIERMARMREGDDLRGEEWVIARKDGERRTVAISTSRVELLGGTEAVVGLMQDVTERKKSEAALRQRLLELTVLGRVGEICTGSHTEDELLHGVTHAIADAFYPDNCGFLLLDPERRVLVTHPSFVLSDPAVSRVDKPLGTGITGQVALSGCARRVADVSQEPGYLAADARTRSELCVPLRIGASVAGVFNVESDKPDRFSDTDQKVLSTVVDLVGNAMGRLRSEQNLRASEERFRGLVEGGFEGINVLDATGWSIYSSPTNAALVGLGSSEVDDNALGFVHPDDLPAMQAALAQIRLTAGQAFDLQTRLLRKDGTSFWAEAHARNLLDHPAIRGIVVNWRDVTDRKRAEDKLRESEARFRALFEHAVEGMYQTVPEGRFLAVNRALAWMLGCTSPEEVIDHYRDLGRQLYVVPERRRELMDRVNAEGYASGFEFEVYRKDGSRTTLSVWARAVRDDSARLLYFEGGAEDITERKLAAERLRQSEERFRLASEAFQGLLYDLDLVTGSVYRSAGVTDLLGYSQDEIAENKDAWIRLLHPDDRVRVLAAVDTALAGRDQIDVEYRLRHRSGHYVDVWDRGRIVRAPNGTSIRIVGSTIGQSARKQAEAALRESEARLRQSTEAANVGLWDWDLTTNLVYYSPKWKSQIGYREDEISNDFNEWQNRVHPADLEQALQNVHESLANPVGRYESEFRLRHKDGHYRWIYVNGDVLRDETGKPVRMLGCHIDITERKRAEEAVFKQKQRYQLLLKTSQDAIHVVARDGKLREWNDAFLAHLGYSADEAITLKVMDWDTQWNQQELIEKIESLFKQGGTFETTHRRKDGSIRNVEISATGFVFDGEEFVLASARDISERKQAEAALRQSQRNYREIFNSVNEAVFIHDAETGAILDVNEAMLTLYSCRREEVQQLKPHDLSSGVSPYSEADAMEWLRKAATEGPQTFEWQARKLTGELFSVEVSLKSATINDQSRILAVVRDITERKRAEKSLEESSSRHRSIVQAALDGFWRTDRQGRLLEANTAYCRMSGYTMPELLTKTVADLECMAPEDIVASLKVLADRGWHRFESRHRRKDGSTYDVEISVQLRSGDSGEMVGFLKDVTERKQSETALRISQERLRAIVAATPSCIKLLDADGTLLEMNACGLGLVEAAEATEVIGHCVYPIIAPEHRAAFTEFNARICAGQADSLEFEIVGLRGTRRWMQSHAVPLRDPASGKSLQLAITQEITERKQAEAALRASEDRFRKVVEAVPIGLVMTDEGGRITLVNTQAEKAFGYARDELVGQPIELLVPHSIRARHPEYRRAFLADPKNRYMGRGRNLAGVRKDGTEFPVEVGLVPMSTTAGMKVLAAVADVTSRMRAEEERHKLEAQIQHAQKLESLGVLAGGIAHDFNNILTSILGYSDLALMELPSHSPARPLIAEAVNGARQAADLTKQMLAYSGKGKFVIESLDLNQLIEDMSHLLQVSISKKCVLQLHPLRELPTIQADAVQMRQIIMNLIINASDAIGDRSGIIAVTSGVMYCDRACLSDAYLDENLPEGLYVFLEVADTGSGMSEETRARIFDPFFTTKGTGRGLGLAAVLGIVRGHRGALKVQSAVGKGATFTVLFPATIGPAQLEPARTVEASEWRGSGLVLVVDDEESVRGLTRQMMERMGFTVLTAADGREAVELFRKESERIRLVLLDMTMPYLDGGETFREMKRIRTGVPTVLSSGYSERTATNRFGGNGLSAFIQKPYQYQQLLAVVRKALSAEAEPN
jgi:two-component system cell cycle sensor histidine kinase/response regulator CckA